MADIRRGPRPADMLASATAQSTANIRPIAPAPLRQVAVGARTPPREFAAIGSYVVPAPNSCPVGPGARIFDRREARCLHRTRPNWRAAT
jgi:hypothetical protein